MPETLREKIANRIFSSGMLREREGGDAALWEASLKLADFVIAIPEIAEALRLVPVKTMRKQPDWAKDLDNVDFRFRKVELLNDRP